jgi:hypothetical protein
MTLATFRRTGVEVRTPGWLSAVDGKIYLSFSRLTGRLQRRACIEIEV